MKLPTKNVVYYHFDGGKVHKNRQYKVLIKDIVLFKDIDQETLALWAKEVNDCAWLYAKKTDYFIQGELDNDEKVIYCRTKDQRWFSLGFWAGVLDIDETLHGTLLTNESL